MSLFTSICIVKENLKIESNFQYIGLSIYNKKSLFVQLFGISFNFVLFSRNNYNEY